MTTDERSLQHVPDIGTRRAVRVLIAGFLITALLLGSCTVSAGSTGDYRASDGKEINPSSTDVAAQTTVAPAAAATNVSGGQKDLKYKGRVTPEERAEAAVRYKKGIQDALGKGIAIPRATLDPGGVPHYFGPFPNYANSPMPSGAIANITIDDAGTGYFAPVVTIMDLYNTGSGAMATATSDPVTGAITAITLVSGGSGYTAPAVYITNATAPQGSDAMASATIGGPLTGGLKKFTSPLPNIAVAVPDTTAYPGADYYEIQLRQYTEQMHPDMPATTLRGYVQVKNGVDVAPISYLGPMIVAKRDRPVRIKFTNKLPTGAGGNLFIPVDNTVMGAGMGPLMHEAMPMDYTQNRATLHLHGGFVPWISDGTPHQWITPAGEMTSYPKGVSVQNVPDMPDPGDGSMTFYYNNQQSARLQFYHDHSYGITRLNVYAGEAAPYVITDNVEQDMIAGTNTTGINPTGAKVIPDTQIPLVIQDKTFIDANTIGSQDPTWKWGSTSPVPHTGDLWMPHVYMPNQNPYDLSGMNAFGRWHYGPWFWPPTTNIAHGPVANPYYDPANESSEPPVIPGVPSNSMGMEAFMDTPVVNGEAYPYLDVQPKAYRFRILNAADDRFVNLQMYVADPTVTTTDGRTNTEVKMVPAPDGRDGGIPDPAMSGPSFIQIGTEGGFLPAPVVLPNQPVGWNFDQTNFDFGNVNKGTLIVGTAERADVIVDFSQYAGKTIILYNDAPAPFPAIDPRYDYYTGNPDNTGAGGAPTTQPGYGPNTRTIMQIRVAAATPAPAYNLATLQSVFAKAPGKRGVFEVSQDEIIVPQPGYNTAYNANFKNSYVGIHQNTHTYQNVSGATVTSPRFEPKAIQDEMGEAFDEYGRMSGFLGLQLDVNIPQNFILLPFASPPVELIKSAGIYGTPLGNTSDGTQFWKITHNGVDTHTIHVHLFNAQLINRVAWDNAVRLPDLNELGWKETFRVNPLQDTIVAFRPITPTQSFDVPNSVRLIDPTMPEGATLMGGPFGLKDPAGNPITVTNHKVNYGWEYVYHCHLLSHEEMDMMHSMAFATAPKAPTNLTATALNGNQGVQLAWKDNSISETGFTIQRAGDPGFTTGLATFSVAQNTVSYTDASASRQGTYYYRVLATNVVGDTALYGGVARYPTKSAESAWSNTASPSSGPVPTAPVANFTMSRSSGTAPLLVRFTDTSTGSPTSWRWDFAGRWTTAQNPAVIFRTPGVYTVKLTVSNAYGTSSISKTVTVVAPAGVRRAPDTREEPVEIVG